MAMNSTNNNGVVKLVAGIQYGKGAFSYLLARRISDNLIGFPEGELKDNESPEKAIERVWKETTGLAQEANSHYEIKKFKNGNTEYEVYHFTFEFQKEPVINKSLYSELNYVPLKELTKIAHEEMTPYTNFYFHAPVISVVTPVFVGEPVSCL